jgi:hypothetical protein
MPRPPRPLELEDLLRLVAKQHRSADADRNGFLTLIEIRGQIGAAAEAAVRSRFQTIDTNRNGALEYDEFAAWQNAMGSLVLSDVAAASIGRDMIPETLPFETDADMRGDMLRMLVEPVGATTIVQSDANYDGQVDLVELQQYQRRKFDRLDANRDGLLEMMELPRPGPGGPPPQLPPGMAPPTPTDAD